MSERRGWKATTLFGLNSFAAGALLALKISHAVTWSWWIVLLPFEWPLVTVVVAIVGIAVVRRAPVTVQSLTLPKHDV